ncbi:MAG: nitroreductase [Deltaproteobacteria bacterium]|nr:nitroreductase [Deltaproteobacteria bacterium]
MNYAALMEARFSCRAYLETPVTAREVQEIVSLAGQAPSWGNTQPWRVYAANGEAARQVRQRLVLAFREGRTPTPEIPMPQGFAGRLMDNYRLLGRELFGHLGLGREDKERRDAHYANNFNAFGAPTLVWITVPAGQTAYVMFDAGAFVTAFCLAAAARGLGTCILAALARYPEEVRQVMPIPEDEAIVIGVALGNPDPAAPANRFRSRREPLGQVLTMTGF